MVMKTTLATIAAISMVASPVYAATTTKSAPSKATTHSVAAQAKAEHESVKTEAKEVRHHTAAKHQYGKYRNCPPSHMAAAHHHKAATKTAKKTA